MSYILMMVTIKYYSYYEFIHLQGPRGGGRSTPLPEKTATGCKKSSSSQPL